MGCDDMKFGVLKDIKNGEYRVIATPCEVSTLVGDGAEVFVQRGDQERPPLVDTSMVLLLGLIRMSSPLEKRPPPVLIIWGIVL